MQHIIPDFQLPTHSLSQMLNALRLMSVETSEAFRSEICEMMNKIDDSTQERIREICAICGEIENI